VAGPAPTVQQVAAALGAARARAPATTQVRLAALDGRVFLMTDDRRLDSSGAEAPLSAADLMAAGARLGPVADQGPIRREDAYYFAHHRPVILPAWRVRLADGRRVYLDPRSAAVLADVDRSAQGFRWLHAAPHRLDFVPGARDGAAWAAMALALLAAVTGGVAIGAWLGVRRILHDLARLRGAARPT
jgi:hypothetical protein